MQLSLRPATPEDLRFVRSSWFESYRKGGLAPEVDFQVYREGMNARIDHLATPGLVTIAHLPEVPDEIVGWTCWWGKWTHYVYVKQAYRKLGVGRTLVGVSDRYTHETRAGRRFAKRLGLLFDPFLLMNP